MAFMISLAAIQGMIAMVGLARAFGDSGMSRVIVRSVDGAAPGPVADLLTVAIEQAQRAGARQQLHRHRVRDDRMAHHRHDRDGAAGAGAQPHLRRGAGPADAAEVRPRLRSSP